MQNLKLLVGVIGGTLVLVIAIAFLFSTDESGSTETVLADSELTEASRRYVTTIGTDNLSNSDASDSAETEADLITIVEFSDLQCPACRASQPLVDKVLSDNPGRVELIYRHFPLESIHQHAHEAAVASEVVGEQGLFWEYVAILFKNQPDWSIEKDPTPLFIEYAQEVGADTTDFESKLDDSKYKSLVEDDIKDGYALGVNSTPTFYVEGEKLNATELSTAVNKHL